jgi:hypothetical protein
MRASIHAQTQALERAQNADLVSMWHRAREATVTDFVAFSAKRCPGHTYRVGRYQGRECLLIARGKLIVTVRVKRG